MSEAIEELCPGYNPEKCNTCPVQTDATAAIEVNLRQGNPMEALRYAYFALQVQQECQAGAPLSYERKHKFLAFGHSTLTLTCRSPLAVDRHGDVYSKTISKDT